MTMNTRTAKTKEKSNRDEMLVFRATTETKEKVEAIRSLMKVGSTSEVIRRLINEQASELGVK